MSNDNSELSTALVDNQVTQVGERGTGGQSAVSIFHGGGKQLSGLVPPEAYGSRTALVVERIPAPATLVVAQALVVHDRAVASVAEILVVWVVGWCVFHT